MKKIIVINTALLFSITFYWCKNIIPLPAVPLQFDLYMTIPTTPKALLVSDNAPSRFKVIEEIAIKSLVEAFGKMLQRVSLLAPKAKVIQSIQENYSAYVSPTLLEKWKNRPQSAPGRMVSSPWPDRIEVLSITKRSKNEYEVKGQIIEITSMEKVGGGYSSKKGITLEVKKIRNHWLIDAVT
jgi:hypothetical protein